MPVMEVEKGVTRLEGRYSGEKGLIGFMGRYLRKWIKRGVLSATFYLSNFLGEEP